MSVEQKQLTATDVWNMPEVPGKRFELIDGELVEMPGAGMLHNLIAAIIYESIREVVRTEKIGYVFTDGLGFLLGGRPDQLRIPDVSFVSLENMPQDGVQEGYCPVSPDLAVEVVSPNDSAAALHDKVRDYLAAGTQIVWVVWPGDRTVTVHSPDGLSRDISSDDELDGGDVIPGLTIRVAHIFDVDL